MLAKTMPSLLPPLSASERLNVTKIHSLAGLLLNDVSPSRPFRAPHHTSSQIAIIGGGSKPKPGEVSLANHGVLFLDEVPEYPRAILEALRQPLEDKTISVTRANGRATYPADFMLIATMNPCPCGYYGDATKECSCSSTQILAYQKRLSGPFLDRIDMVVPVSRVNHEDLLGTSSLSSGQHKNAYDSILTARERQRARYGSSKTYNASLSSSQLRASITVSDSVKQFLDTAASRLDLSPRSYFKVIKVAQTIADLEDADDITTRHVSEALQYRYTT